VQVDPKLPWRPHINSVKKKVTGQMKSLTTITFRKHLGHMFRVGEKNIHSGCPSNNDVCCAGMVCHDKHWERQKVDAAGAGQGQNEGLRRVWERTGPPVYRS
jgi:hypothetical protein